MKVNKYIRNFCIIAHVDHGKSTLADRMIELTQTVSEREMKNQLLDNMELERERGITIKLQTLRMSYKAKDDKEYLLNLIDTPGHADFGYEVSRSIAACEGAILLVDATQGVQAQTLANLKLAKEQGIVVIPVINKIDMENADVESVIEEMKSIEEIDSTRIILASAKTGEGVKEIMEQIIENIPAPPGVEDESLQALVFDSHYDSYLGVILHVRVFNGKIQTGMKLKDMSEKNQFEAYEVGIFHPQMESVDVLSAGDVGYIATNRKDNTRFKTGDTITDMNKPALSPLPGYKEMKPFVFSGLFPVDSKDEERLKDAVGKLSLNDAAFQYEIDNSNALGVGFHCGFLGVLHLEVVKERLEREYGIELISTAPAVTYHIQLKNGETIPENNPMRFPSFEKIEHIYEPYVKVTILIQEESIGDVMRLCQSRRGTYLDTHYLNEKTVELVFELPLSEIVYNFYDSLKSLTHGYSSIDYVESGYKPYDLVKMDIWLNDVPVDAFSFVLPREQAYEKGKEIITKMKYVIPHKMYPMPVQSVVENKVIAREDIPPLRKSVTGKGYSGSASKKKKIAKTIKENSIRQRKFGKADIPQEAFQAILDIR